MQKAGAATDIQGQREAVLRVASEIISSNKSLQALDLPLQTFVNVLVKTSSMMQHSARLERQVCASGCCYVCVTKGMCVWVLLCMCNEVCVCLGVVMYV